jgi:hypothetical protein
LRARSTSTASCEEIAERLSRFPEIGAPVETKAGWRFDLRRVVLSRHPLHLYYRLDLEREEIELACLWGARRPRPKL